MSVLSLASFPELDNRALFACALAGRDDGL